MVEVTALRYALRRNEKQEGCRVGSDALIALEHSARHFN